MTLLLCLCHSTTLFVLSFHAIRSSTPSKNVGVETCKADASPLCSNAKTHSIRPIERELLTHSRRTVFPFTGVPSRRRNACFHVCWIDVWYSVWIYHTLCGSGILIILKRTWMIHTSACLRQRNSKRSS